MKGYGDTHARGWRNFEAVMGAIDRAGVAITPAAVRELRNAALADEEGKQLHRVLDALVPAPKEAV